MDAVFIKQKAQITKERIDNLKYMKIQWNTPLKKDNNWKYICNSVGKRRPKEKRVRDIYEQIIQRRENSKGWWMHKNMCSHTTSQGPQIKTVMRLYFISVLFAKGLLILTEPSVWCKHRPFSSAALEKSMTIRTEVTECLSHSPTAPSLSPRGP